MNRQTLVLIGVFATILAISGLAYYLTKTYSRTEEPVSVAESPVKQERDGLGPSPKVTPTPVKPSTGDSVFERIFGSGESAQREEPQSWGEIASQVTFRFALAALLTSLLAFRPRRKVAAYQRNPYVAQTQLLLAVVASALMMIVGDSAARAFGIFAAASLVRFRTNIRDPKEITVLLICLGVGLATGVGLWEVAVILTVFVLITLWTLEYFEPGQIFRSMDLSVTTRGVDRTHETLKQVFARHDITAELRQLNREDEGNPLGKIVYFVNVRGALSTDKLSEEIFSADPSNVDSVEWDQKQSLTYLYK